MPVTNVEGSGELRRTDNSQLSAIGGGGEVDGRGADRSLAPARAMRDSPGVTGQLPRPDRTQVRLAIACIACYAVGYPVAILAHSGVGWVLVTVGGVLLLALGVVTVRRIDRSRPR